ncbi:TIGR04141 family sporadically distributed protein [Brevibacillus agri]|uniref:TIGR04141 family sporadically distributed protein n=1 Tax=Brevibacillus agri TaxID=51101 RepID=UPI002E1A4082|nr:TIGR04141 family sporadically distributed protein [Brevibacillus agri]
MSKVKLAVLLIKKEYQDFRDVIKEDVDVNFFDLHPELELDGVICIGANTHNLPEWYNFLRKGTNETIPQLTNSSTRAVLFIRYNGYLFAFVFGMGRYLIKDEAIIRDFGIKVVLNSVNPSMLRSIDTSTFDEITIHSRTQTSKMSGINNFGLDIIRDYLRAATGVPNKAELGSVISGRDSVHFSFELNYQDIKDLCCYLFTQYQSAEYRKNFEWFDNLQYITDSVLLNNLNNKLVSDISTGNASKLHLAPPEIINWDEIGGFSFTEMGQVYDDLKANDFFNLLKQRNIEVTEKKLKRRSIYVKDSNHNTINKWSIYNSIVYETVFNDEYYILTFGYWFKINRVFVDVVQSYLATISESTCTLPECGLLEKEGDYNNRVSTIDKDVLTLDRELVRYNGSSIEVCDLLTRDKKLIHVKPWDSSSTLSHLFSQGRVSAELLIQEIEFRKLTRQKISGLDISFVNVIEENFFNPREYEIVFAIIDPSNNPLRERLPFFSKLNMMQNVKYLRNLGFSVTLKKIIRR